MAQITKENLLIVSHVQHYSWEGKFWAFGPYTREIDIWADLFPSVIIASPLKNEKPGGDCLPFTRSNISVSPINSHFYSSVKFKIFHYWLGMVKVSRELSVVMRTASVIHLRLPGNLGALGALIAPFYSKCIIAKYAGTWPNFKGEPFSYRMQKALLRSRWFKGPVTVYGDWPNQPDNIIPFFTSILTNDQLERAKESAKNHFQHKPARIVFVGRMDRGKNAHILLEAIDFLKQSGYETEVRIIGDGKENERLRKLVSELQISNQVRFTGALPFEQVLDQYEWGDILVLVSENAEGWPKAIAEAMAFGLVCFGSSRGLIPQMLADGRGIVIDPISSTALAGRMIELLNSSNDYSDISKKAAEWSQKYSLEGLQQALRDLMSHYWNLDMEINHSENSIE